MVLETLVTIPEEHPALPGHFPGNPVVPGVVTLGEVLQALRTQAKKPLTVLGMPSVKFFTTLRPGRQLVIHLQEEEKGTISFTCTSESHVVAAGTLSYCEEAVVHAERK